MLFTPNNKRDRDWYWFSMLLFYFFSLAFGAGSIGVLLSFELVLLERIALAAVFLLIAAVMWASARRCATIVAQMGPQDRRQG